MKIFQIERNDNCPCGSGRKFKRCCQDQVEDATRRIIYAMGVGSFTAQGLEVIETLGFICGLQAEDGHMPEPERLGRLLKETWEEEEKIQLSQDEGALGALSMAFQVLLGEKHQLGLIRIPVWQFEPESESQGEAEDAELIDGIIEYMGGPGGRMFITDAVNSIGMSLLYDDYTDGELKTLLAALSWLVVDESRDLFLGSVLYKTKSDLVAASEKIDKVMDEYGDDDSQIYQEMRSIFYNYPVYDQMMSDRMDGDINFVMDAVANGGLKIEVPLYSVLGGIYAMVSKLVESFNAKYSPRGSSQENLPPLEEVLFAGGEYHFYFPEVVSCFDKALKETEDSEFEDALNSLLFFLILSSDTKQLAIIKFLYVRCVCTYLSRFPVILPEADLEFKVPGDYCDQKLIEHYACYLESQDMKMEAIHVRDVLKTLGEQAEKEAFLYEDEVINYARLLLDEGEEEE